MSLDVFDEFKNDTNAENQGVWLPLKGHSKVKVARAGNDNWTAEYQRLGRRLRSMFENGELDEGQSADIIAKLMARTILKDWDGLAQGGEEIPYTESKAYELLYNLPDFRKRVMDLAMDEQNFRERTIQQDLGNSKSGSAGSTATETTSSSS